MSRPRASIASFSAIALQIALVALAACAGPEAPANQPRPILTLLLGVSSTAFADGQPIPAKYTCDEGDVSPALSWGSLPERAKTLAVICDDPDAPGGTWVHWVLYNLSSDADGLPEAVPATKTVQNGGLQGKNDFGRIGYGGPCPPRGPAHRYLFNIYALDRELDLKPGATRRQVEDAMLSHVLAQGTLTGKYARR